MQGIEIHTQIRSLLTVLPFVAIVLNKGWVDQKYEIKAKNFSKLFSENYLCSEIALNKYKVENIFSH